MKKSVKIANAITGVSAVAMLASFTPDFQSIENQDLCSDQLSLATIQEFDSSTLPAGKGYTVLNYYYNGGLAGGLAGTYAAATQGAMWGMVGGPAVGFAVGLGFGI